MQLTCPAPPLGLRRAQAVVQPPLLDGARVRHRRRGARRERLQEHLVLVVEARLVGEAVEGGEDSDRDRSVDERDDQRGLGAGDSEGAVLEPEPGLHVGDPLGALGLERAAHEAARAREASAVGGARHLARAGGDTQCVALGQQQHDGARVDQRAPALDDQLEHAIELGLAAQRHCDRQRRLQPAHGTLELGAPALGGLEEARVLDPHARPRGECDHCHLVGGRELAAAGLLGQVEVAPRPVPDQDRNTEERAHRRMRSREAVGLRMVTHVREPQRVRFVDEHAENPAPAREIADRPVRRLVDPEGHEALQPGAVLVEHADRRVLRARDLGRDLQQLAQDPLEVEVGDERAACAEQPAQGRIRQLGRGLGSHRRIVARHRGKAAATRHGSPDPARPLRP